MTKKEPLRTPEELARKVASVMGEASAAARAIKELERRRAAGEEVVIYIDKRAWLVGPPNEKL